MDGRGRWMDNVFIERLWRSLKYGDVDLKDYADGRGATRGIADWIAFYNERRPHQPLADRTPMSVWREAIAGAAEAHAASCRVIERNNKRSVLQPRTEIKRSRCAPPFQKIVDFIERYRILHQMAVIKVHRFFPGSDA